MESIYFNISTGNAVTVEVRALESAERAQPLQIWGRWLEIIPSIYTAALETPCDPCPSSVLHRKRGRVIMRE